MGRIQPLLEKYPDFFGSLEQHPVHRLLDGASDKFYDIKTGHYHPISHAIALALETDTVELFGEIPGRKNPKTPSHAAARRSKYLEVLRDLRRHNNIGDPYVAILGNDFRKALTKAMETLTPLQAESLTTSFGINNGKETLESIAQRRGCTKQNVQQQVKAALAKLKKDPTLRNYDPLSS